MDGRALLLGSALQRLATQSATEDAAGLEAAPRLALLRVGLAQFADALASLSASVLPAGVLLFGRVVEAVLAPALAAAAPSVLAEAAPPLLAFLAAQPLASS